MDDQRHARLMARAFGLATEGTMLTRVCAGALSILEVDGSGLLLASKSPGDFVAHAGALTPSLLELEYGRGQGPDMDALRTGVDVVVPDLTRSNQWPLFSPEACEMGVAAIFSLHVEVASVEVGVLHLHRSAPGSMTVKQLDDARVLAELCSILVIDAADVGAGKTPEDLFGAPDRAVVHQATGMVSVQAGTDMASSLALMRAHAFATTTPLHSVANDVVERKMRFDL